MPKQVLMGYLQVLIEALVPIRLSGYLGFNFLKTNIVRPLNTNWWQIRLLLFYALNINDVFRFLIVVLAGLN